MNRTLPPKYHLLPHRWFFGALGRGLVREAVVTRLCAKNPSYDEISVLYGNVRGEMIGDDRNTSELRCCSFHGCRDNPIERPKPLVEKKVVENYGYMLGCDLTNCENIVKNRES